MKNNYVLALVCALLITAQGVQFGQEQATRVVETGQTVSLTLSVAIQRALEYNKDILIAKEDVKKSDAQIGEAYSNAFPHITLEATYTRYIELPVLFLPPNTAFNPSSATQTIKLGSDNSFSVGASLSQVLFNAKVNNAIRIAEDYEAFNRQNLQATTEDVILAVKQTFYGVLLLRKVVEVNREGLDLASANFENVKLLFKEGLVSEFDLLRAEVQKANQEPEVSKAENNLEVAMNALRNLLGYPLDQPVEISEELQLQEIPEMTLRNESLFLLEKNSTLKGLRSLERIYDRNIAIEESDYYPTLAAFSQYQYQTQDNTFDFSKFNWATNFLVGLQVSYPIFSGWSTKNRVQQAEIDKEKATLTRLKAEDGLQIQARDAELKMLEAKKRISAQTKTAEQAQRAVEIATVRFKSGMGTQLELIDAQVALSRSRTLEAQSVYDYMAARAQWERLTGYTAQ